MKLTISYTKNLSPPLVAFIAAVSSTVFYAAIAKSASAKPIANEESHRLLRRETTEPALTVGQKNLDN